MNKKFVFTCACISMLSMHSFAFADIYKHVDADGRVTYSNVKIKGAKKINLEPADTNFGTKPTGENVQTQKQTTPNNFPTVDANTQKSRDNARKQILLSELETEKQALEQAKKAYAEGEANPEVHRLPNGGTRRNLVKYEEKMQKLQADVDAHQRNIELLQKEISNLN